MAAGSIAVRDLLTAPARPARVLAVFPQAVYLQVEGLPGAGAGVVALLARDAVRLPLGVVVEAEAATAPFAGLAPGGRALVGDAAVRCDAGQWRVLRWWDPRVPVLRRPAGPAPDRAPDQQAVDDAVARLVGRGPGLTPAGDDVLCGALAALTAVGDDARRGPLASAVLRHVHRTTTLSAALLRHAAAGHGLPQLTRLLSAVLRDDPLQARRRALADLLAIGHTSGAALAAGALLTLRTPTPPVIMHERTGPPGRTGANVHDHGQGGGGGASPTREEAA